MVRHVPVDPNTFADWGLALTNYTSKPTWVYASPHNILRWTAQTSGATCSSACHNAPAGGVLLRESDLYEADGVTPLPDYECNLEVIIDESFSTSNNAEDASASR